MGISALWSIITGAGKTGDVIDTGMDIVKMGASGLDKLVYTSEEKAIDGAANIAKNMDHALAFAKIAQSESGASAVTRRIVALIILANFSIFVQVGLVLVCLGKIEIVNNIIAFSKAVSIGEMSLAIVVSLFGYYAITKGRK